MLNNCKNYTSNKCVFFVCYGGGHANIINEIASYMLKNNNIKFKILALTSAYNPLVEIFGDTIVKSISDYQFLFIDRNNEILEHGNNIAVFNSYTKISISKDDLIYYLGVSMINLIDKYGKKQAYKYYKTYGRKIFLPIDILEKILKFENPSLVFSTISPRFERASLIAANNLNIESMQIHDLYIDPKNIKLDAKYVIVMNQEEKIKLLEKYPKYNSSNVYALGQPIIDKTVDCVNKIKIKKKKQTLCFITPGSYKITNKVYLYKIFNLFNQLYKLYNMDIIIRVHPNLNKKEYLRYIKNKNYIHIYEDTKMNLCQTLAISDFIITYQSTVALESMALNKKVFTFKSSIHTEYNIKRFKYKPFIFSNNFYQLSRSLKLIRNKNNYKNNIYSKNNSSEKIVNLMRNIIYK